MRNVERFLALWKNETGEIENQIYKSDGKKVKYDDIYKGKIIVGDIFESGPEMWFELLDITDSTKGLVDIFKYIMYLYTGVDYGISEESQISYIFSTVPYAGSDYNVHTKMSSEELVLTKEQLKEAIEKSWKEGTKNNLLSCLDAFMEIQNTYNVNAVFAVAVTVQESQGGTAWNNIDSSTYNWMSIKGEYNGNSYEDRYGTNWRKYDSFNIATKDFGDLIANSPYYFKGGKYSVKNIAPTYCDENWGSKVIAHMTKMYNNIGISGATGGTEGTDGTVTTFTVGTRTYKNYKQTDYANVTLAYTTKGASIANAGCAIVSVAIIANGFGQDVDPIDVNDYYRVNNTSNHAETLEKYTKMTCSWELESSKIESGVRNQLRRGYPTIVHVPINSGTFSTKQGHFFVVLSISEDGQSVYISNPSSKKDGYNNGWIKASTLFNAGLDRYMKME